MGDIDSVSILGFEREYLDGLLEVAAKRRHGQHLLVLFLGSTVGNFDRPAAVTFLREVRRILDPHHGTKLDQLEEAAKVLGARLVIAYEPA